MNATTLAAIFYTCEVFSISDPYRMAIPVPMARSRRNTSTVMSMPVMAEGYEEISPEMEIKLLTIRK